MQKRFYLFLAISVLLLVATGGFTISQTSHSSQQLAVQPEAHGKVVIAPQIEPKVPETLPVESASSVPSVGYVTRHHAAELANDMIKVPGYMLRNLGGYIIISDEKVDTPNPHDLPVTGPGIGRVVSLHEYLFTGRLIKGGLNASNKNPYHLELSAAPTLIH